MVVSWSPEPSKSKDGWPSRNANHIINFEEESDEDNNMFNVFGYELLPHDINNEFSDEADAESDSNSNSSGSQDVAEENETPSMPDVPQKFDELPRQEIVINLDEVREAMSNITLPDSAIPPWAANVPESQWTSFILTRIRNIQNPDNT